MEFRFQIQTFAWNIIDKWMADDKKILKPTSKHRLHSAYVKMGWTFSDSGNNFCERKLANMRLDSTNPTRKIQQHCAEFSGDLWKFLQCDKVVSPIATNFSPIIVRFTAVMFGYWRLLCDMINLYQSLILFSVFSIKKFFEVR